MERKTRTQQQYQQQCDVNYIMKQYLHTGTINHIAQKKGVYADHTKLPDYHAALNIVKSAESGFMSLDAQVRKRFQNDPQQLINFLSDPKNRPEAEKLGLVEKAKGPAIPIPIPAPILNP